MYCSNCGAPLKDTDAKCPYCGTINVLAAEAEYMDKLKTIRKNVENLEELPKQTYSQTLKHHARLAAKIALITAGVAFLFFGGIYLYGTLEDRHYSNMEKQEILFRKEFFPKLNELYSTEDDKAVIEYMETLYEEDGATALYDWEHAPYYELYMDHCYLFDFKDALKHNRLLNTDLTSGLYQALHLIHWEDIHKSSMFSPRELENLEAFSQDAKDILVQDLQLSESDYQKIYEACSQDSYLSFSKLDEYVEEHLSYLLSKK